MHLSRRELLECGAAVTLGTWAARPSNARASAALSAPAADLVAQALDGLDPARIVDVHVHLVGNGSGGTGCWVNPVMHSPRHPIKVTQFIVYALSSGMWNPLQADQLYLERLVQTLRSSGLKHRALLVAFSKAFHEDGTQDVPATEFHVPNAYVLAVAQRSPDLFLPAISVHPYDPTALEQLEAGRAQGAVAVKWLPNAMGMDPASPKCDAFYAKLVELQLVLLSHAGKEQAVDAASRQELGNPLRLRRPLNAGVKIILAHCGGLGASLDLDAPEKGRGRVESFDLFLRLMGEQRYESLLYADVSAMAQVNRSGRPLREILSRTALHPRLIYGSDYPLPAISVLTHPQQLASRGYLTQPQANALNALQRRNPLLFDFVLKRTLAVRQGGKTTGFASCVFQMEPQFFASPPSVTPP